MDTNVTDPCYVSPKKPTAFAKQLKIVHAILETINPFPVSEKKARQALKRPGVEKLYGFTLGKTRRLDWKDKLTDSKRNRDFPELHLACQRLFNSVAPDFQYNCIQVNKNNQCALHRDMSNLGPSLILGLGPYKGGQVLVHYDNRVVGLDIANRVARFDGRLPHETTPFSGTRYSLVAFNLSPRNPPKLGYQTLNTNATHIPKCRI